MTKIKVVKSLTDAGWPTNSKRYKRSHRQANKVEKRGDPKTYAKTLKLEKKLGKHELMAKHTKKGTIEIERKFAKPKRLKKDLIRHEKAEHRVMVSK